MPSISRGRALAYLLAMLMLLTLGGRFLLGGSSDKDEQDSATAQAALELEELAPEERSLVVHIVGAVRRPGLYELSEGSRIDDAIRSAGGPKARAALELVNLAAPIADGQQVVVPFRAPGQSSPESLREVAGGPASGGGPVHLNTATREQLESLPGVGPITAQKILEYREQHGAFQSVEELDAVPGIGPTRLAALKELVQL